MTAIATLVVAGCFAAPLLIIGRYGWRNAERLAVTGGAFDEHRFRVLRRGSVACVLVAVFFLSSSAVFFVIA